jgi:predicted acylesterase/phospholipase RssA
MNGSKEPASMRSPKNNLATELSAMLAEEIEFVRTRKEGRQKDDPLVAVALSGGGVRAGTVSLGFLQALQELQILKEVDYLSSVSGGGYAHGYLLTAASTFSDENEIFGDHAVKELTGAGRYLASGRGWRSSFRALRLLGSVLSMTLLNLAWMLSILALAGVLVSSFFSFGRETWPSWFPSVGTALKGLLILVALPLLRLVALTLMQIFVVGFSFSERSDALERWTVRISILLGKALNWVDGLALTIGLCALLLLGLAPAIADWVCRGLALCTRLAGWNRPLELHTSWVGLALLTLGAGFLISCDVIGVNAVFRNLIDSAYLRAPRRVMQQKKLKQSKMRPPLFLHEAAQNLNVPYPLFGGGLYLQGESDPTRGSPHPVGWQLLGTQVMDYFLFSERFCGSFATRYARSNERPFSRTTIADAIACSAASVSPLMDGNSNVATRLLLSLLNLNLGVWLPNPKTLTRLGIGHFFRFWPLDYIRMVKRDLHAQRALVYVADGGFIDNLGVMELFRRRCSVIIAIDNTWDPEYDFHYLRNLMVRARTEEALTINFRCNVEDDLRPSPVTGFARSDHAIADVIGQDRDGNSFHGCLLFIKATLTGPFVTPKPVSQLHRANGGASSSSAEPKNENVWAAEYQTYHPHFPQESTADQFFDPAQWNAYFRLGQRLAKSALDGLVSQQSVTRRSLLEVLTNVSATQAESITQTLRANGGV